MADGGGEFDAADTRAVTGEDVLRIDASGQRRNRAESAAVRAALAAGQEVAFTSRRQRYHYRKSL